MLKLENLKQSVRFFNNTTIRIIMIDSSKYQKIYEVAHWENNKFYVIGKVKGRSFRTAYDKFKCLNFLSEGET